MKTHKGNATESFLSKSTPAQFKQTETQLGSSEESALRDERFFELLKTFEALYCEVRTSDTKRVKIIDRLTSTLCDCSAIVAN